MKKIMMIAAMMVATLSASAQNEVGQITLKPTVGINIAKITKLEDNKARTGLLAGVEAEYGVAENFGLTAGLFYSMQGGKQDWGTGKVYVDGIPATYNATLTWKTDFLNIPIMAQYYVIKGLAVKAGIQPGFCVSKKATLEQAGSYAGEVETSKETQKLKGDYETGVKSFAFAIPVGLSYEYANFVLDARYNIGLTKVAKDFNGKHSVFSISLGYKFAL